MENHSNHCFSKSTSLGGLHLFAKECSKGGSCVELSNRTFAFFKKIKNLPLCRHSQQIQKVHFGRGKGGYFNCVSDDVIRHCTDWASEI